MLLDLPLARTELDRSAHLRTNQGALDEMWQRAKIIDLLGDRFKSFNGALSFVDQSAGGERYFLGLDSSGTPYFVAHRPTDTPEFPDEYQFFPKTWIVIKILK